MSPGQVLNAVKSRPGRKAKEIAAELGVTRRQVNAALYGRLSGRVFHDGDFRWWPIAMLRTNRVAPRLPTPVAKVPEVVLPEIVVETPTIAKLPAPAPKVAPPELRPIVVETKPEKRALWPWLAAAVFLGWVFGGFAAAEKPVEAEPPTVSQAVNYTPIREAPKPRPYLAPEIREGTPTVERIERTWVESTPSYSRPSSSDVFVNGYYRRDGTYVRPHHRSAPDGKFSNNWSTEGNVNPYTGRRGTKRHP